ncbi:MAG: glutamate racemase [Candidatus Marinimicrobia bacterium]|nr:glutamate racemase [Candidatus Neomarinimicrobiota bacterium]
MNDSPIGIFDSGIGGLTVVREVTKLLPGEKIVYFGDTARVPYGSKSPNVVREFSMQDALFLDGKSVKSIVVACNTASAESIDLLRSEFDIPVIGVIEPGARTAAESTKKGIVGVIGTYGTVASGAYTEAVHAVDPSIKVESVACPLFVPLVEEGWQDKQVTKKIAEEYLSVLIEKGIDTLILGCTHYPVLKPVLQEVVGDGVNLIDSAVATAAELSRILKENNLESPADQKETEHEFFVSDLPYKFKETAERFLGKELPDVELVPLELLESGLKI